MDIAKHSARRGTSQREKIMQHINKLQNDYEAAAEAENKLHQNMWSSKQQIEQAEQEADEAYGAVIDALYEEQK